MPSPLSKGQRSIKVGALIIALAAWMWVAYLFSGNHLLIAMVQYGLYLVGVLLVARGLGLHVIMVFIAGMVIGLFYEVLGTRTGFPFGSYEYSPVMVTGGLGVPWFIVFMWGLLATIVYLAILPIIKKSPLGVVAASLMLVALDLSIDPVMVSRGLWEWAGGGAWYGVPLSNFLGWFWVGVNIFVVARLVLKWSAGEDNVAWGRTLLLPYVSHLVTYALAAPPGALVSSLVLGIGVIVVLLRVFDL